MISALGTLTDQVPIEMAVTGRSDCFSLLMDRYSGPQNSDQAIS
jgi:hypothetical protein